EFLLNPKGRNFASILAAGGTFTWESWEGGAARSENSESHAYGANAALEAIQGYVLGVAIVKPQAARGRIRPHFGPLGFGAGAAPAGRGAGRPQPAALRSPRVRGGRGPDRARARPRVVASG